MLNEKEFQIEEKECADLLGMTLEEYHNNLKTIQSTTPEINTEPNYDNSILETLGLTVNDLKLQKEV